MLDRTQLGIAEPVRPRLAPGHKIKSRRVDDHARKEYSKYKVTDGDKVIRFCNTLRVPSGKDVGKVVELRDWQCNLIKAIYDPKDVESGRRLIREACLTMARKNGKTSLAAMLVLCHLVGPVTQRNGELYSAGFRRDQAAIIWRACYNMICVDDELTLLCTWSRHRHSVDCGKFGTTYKAISAEAKSKHGFNPVLVILDELSQFSGDRTLYDVFKTSMGAQDEALLLTISTQAADDLAIMSEIIDYGRQVEIGEIADPSFKLVEYFTDDFADIYDPEVWKLANPALGDFRSSIEIAQMAERAKISPSAEQTFRNLYLNQRVASTISLVSPSIWRLNGDQPKNLFRGRKAYLALDLSDCLDLTCLLVLLPDEQAGKLDVIPLFFSPEDTLEDRSKRDRVPYLDWKSNGFLITCPGKSVDYRWVAHKFIEVCEDFEVQLVAFDRWRIKLFKANLELEGFAADNINWVEHGQGFRDMAPAIDMLEEELLSARFRHGNHPVLTFNAGSTKVSKDPAGNRKFDKVRSTGRIDGMVALAMAINAYRASVDESQNSVYEKRGPISVNMGKPQEKQEVRSVWDLVG